MADLNEDALQRAVEDIKAVDGSIALRDLLAFGIHISLDGERISPREWFLNPDDNNIDG